MMKITNKYLVVFTLVLSIIFMISCEDDDKDFIGATINKGGAFPRFTETAPPAVLGLETVDDLSYSFSVSDGNNNIVSYDIDLYADVGGSRTDTVDIAVLTSFPESFSFTRSDLETLLGTSITFGDRFFFTAKATTDSGEEYGAEVQLDFDQIFEQPDGSFIGTNDLPIGIGPGDQIVTTEDGSTFRLRGENNVDEIIQESGYLQAYEFGFVIACPPNSFTIDDIIGTYNVASNGLTSGIGLTDPDPTREVIAGPEANQITIVGGSVGFAGGDDLILDVDFSNGVLALGESGVAFTDSGAGLPFGSDYGELAGFGGLALLCITPQTITVPVTLSCCGGTFTMVLSR